MNEMPPATGAMDEAKAMWPVGVAGTDAGPILTAQSLSISFGGLKAVVDFNLRLKPGELVSIIGPNGAGKSTVFNMLTGVYPPTEGQVLLAGHDITGQPPYTITGLGMARTFQNIRLFKDLSVLDNVRVAFHLRAHQRLDQALLRGQAFVDEEREIERRAHELLGIFFLDKVEGELARNLPYGDQRRLEIVRALATQARVLLLDEPAAGMNPQETLALMKLIQSIRDRFALTVLLIEHHMNLVMGISERILVLDHGCTIAEGTPREVQSDPAVIKAYLGTDE